MDIVASYDLHMHSCLSPCGSEDMTPYHIAAMCSLAGLKVVALTDHNTAGNTAAFCRAAQEFDLIAIPGMELCTSEEVHVVCLFPEVSAAERFSAVVRETIPFDNDPTVFGRQLFMDEGDKVLGEESKMLLAASGIGIYDVVGLMREYGGYAFPAHIDRDSFSLLANLGFYDAAMGFRHVEYSYNRPDDFFNRHPELRDIPALSNSDAHYLEQIQDPRHFLHVKEMSLEAVFESLRGS